MSLLCHSSRSAAHQAVEGRGCWSGWPRPDSLNRPLDGAPDPRTIGLKIRQGSLILQQLSNKQQEHQRGYWRGPRSQGCRHSKACSYLGGKAPVTRPSTSVACPGGDALPASPGALPSPVPSESGRLPRCSLED